MNRIRALSCDHRFLSAAPAQGAVLAVNSKATYLRSDSGELACICPRTVGNGPRIILVEGYGQLAAALQPGAAFTQQGELFRLGADVALDLHGARAWQPALSFPLLAGWPERLETAARLLEQLGHHQEDAWQAAPKARLIEALGGRNWEELDRAVAELVGLGPGLTPAGDDFLTGVIGALHYASAWLPGLSTDAAQLAQAIRANLPGRTHPVSELFTLEAAEGRLTEAYECAFAAVAGGSAAGLRGALTWLIGAGETSGTEMLAGMLAVYEILRIQLLSLQKEINT